MGGALDIVVRLASPYRRWGREGRRREGVEGRREGLGALALAVVGLEGKVWVTLEVRGLLIG